MKQARFISINKEKWAKMENISKLDPDVLASNYVILTDDLSYANTFYPGTDVVDYLNRLLAKYQVNIHSRQRLERTSKFNFWVKDFPNLLYQERRTIVFAFVFFFFAAMIGVFSGSKDDTFARFILGDSYVNRTIRNIESGTPMAIYDSMDALSMFFQITFNNIRVSFIAFVMGIFFSAGTLYILLSNGIMLGIFQYFFFQRGLLLHSALSVWAHGTFEITAIIIAGGAGLVMGNSFLFPGTYKRMESFKEGALKGIKIVVGLIPFFIIAGFIESYITRHADMHPIVGAIAIILSLAGIISYFIIYPYMLNKNTVYEKNKS